MAIIDSDKFILERVVGGQPTNFYADGDQLKEFSPALEPGTIAVFYNSIGQVSPMGWSQVTGSNDNTALRIVKSGGIIGGNSAFTSVFTSRPMNVASHKHGITEGNHSHTSSVSSHGHGVNGGSHSHSSGGAANHDHQSAQCPTNNNGGPNAMTASGNNNAKQGRNTKNASATPSINASGVSYSMSNASISKTSGAASYSTRPSLNNAGEDNPSFNFSIKYANVILCRKDPY